MGGEKRRMPYRNRCLAAVDALLRAGDLLGLALPVFLNDFDTFGVRVGGGTGYGCG